MSDKDKDTAPELKKKRGLMLVLIPLVLIAALGGGWVAFTQYARLSAAAAVFVSEEEKEAPIVYGEFLEIQGIIINPAESNGQRYLMVNVGLESDKGKVLEELETKEIVVRDKLVKLLGERTVPELADVALRQEIKDELRIAINQLLEKGEVQRLYFTQYVLQ